MGDYLSKITAEPEYKIALLGLYRSGKTSVLIRWTPQVDHTAKFFDAADRVKPTIGFNMERVTLLNTKLSIWDLGGEVNARPSWTHYYPETKAIIFVVDSHDEERFGEAKEALDKILSDLQLKGLPLLVFANKQDLPGASDPTAVSMALDLPVIQNRQWQIFGTSASTGEGFYQGLSWLRSKLN